MLLYILSPFVLKLLIK